jgi:phosphopantothenoylcysteine decarboxylase/phosphopantothenate--cysteine ligase
MLKGKKILLGVTGGIAAYKSILLVRVLKKSGAEVKVIFTPDAHDFVTPLTFSTLSNHEVLTHFVRADKTWNNHVELGLWADLFVVAPATANTLAKMAHGICDNLLLATYLSARCPVVLAPAMDFDMYKHPATVQNLDILRKYGNYLINPGTGELASGLSGPGRMAEPEEIFQIIKTLLVQKKKLSGKKILITAGPTIEPIDPVRYISNFSSGKMGYALAEAALNMGASVTLISGKTNLSVHDKIKRIDVLSAQDMFEQVKKHYKKHDVIIMTAAVADFTPQKKSQTKIKKDTAELNIKLQATTDILKYLGLHKHKNQILIGFALETNNEIENARKKLMTKNLDYIVLNSLQDKDAGFGGDYNKVTLIAKNNKVTNFELMPKTQLAFELLENILI